MNLKVGRCVLTCLAARHLTPSPREERAGEGWGGGLLTGSKRLPFRHQRLTEPRRRLAAPPLPALSSIGWRERATLNTYVCPHTAEHRTQTSGAVGTPRPTSFSFG
jgi:hypothetical protein